MAAMGAALVFTRDASRPKLELVGASLTIGRGAECEFRIADDRISTRHCRLSSQGGEWMIQDLKSTNHTFVNGELVGQQPRRLVDGDIVRLGAHDARLFEARFVAGERPGQRDAAAQARSEALQRRITELEAALAARDAEVARMGGMYKRMQAQLQDHEVAAVAARRASAMMTGEIEALRDQLASEQTGHAVCRDQLERSQRRCAELEAQLEVQARRARGQIDDGDRTRKELESKLSLATSELAITRAALATSADNVRVLQAAYDDALVRLRGREAAG